MHDLKPYVAGEQPRIAGWSSSTPMKVHLVLPHARWKPFAARRPIRCVHIRTYRPLFADKCGHRRADRPAVVGPVGHPGQHV